MWNEDKQQRLDVLRVREAQGILTNEERAELEALFEELDMDEAEAMRPALERMQQRQAELRVEKEQLEVKATQLKHIVSEQGACLTGANCRTE